jgi:hypothetical protein
MPTFAPSHFTRPPRQILLVSVFLAAACSAGDAPSGEEVPGTSPNWGDGRAAWEKAIGCEQRLTAPARTVVERPCGTALAVLTDGAYTVRLHRSARRFAEGSAAAAVSTSDWVRPLPVRFAGVVNAAIRDWLLAAADDDTPDLLAMAMQYTEGAPPQQDASGRQIAGDADYGPLSPTGTGDRVEGADFYDYMGVPWTFPDGIREKPLATQLHALDCSGYVRMLWGLRAGLPLASKTAAVSAAALPRRAVQMEAGPFGVSIDIATSQDPSAGLQTGDLVFFDADPADGPAVDHVGMYLGRDEKGSRRFISSRKGATGPTLGDVRGASILDGPGLYAKALRSARRL